ncbi:MAG: hypothetical protein AAGK25_01735 [Pseudomonadota bacterium]
MAQTLIFDPFIPLGALFILGAAALALGLFYCWRQGISGLLRLGALGGLIALLANPQLQTEDRTPLEDIVLVMSDISASQDLDGRDTLTARVRERLAAALGQTGNVRVQTVDLSGTQETRLAEQLGNALADIPRAQLSAVFLLTDGQMADLQRRDDGTVVGGEAIARLLPGNVPFHVLLTGRPDEVDRKIILKNAPRYGIVRESVRVSFRVEDRGPDGTTRNTRQEVAVTLRLDGETIVQQNVPVGQDVGFDVPLDRPGDVIIELSAADLEGELTTRNNIEVLPITAVRDRLRVLLISGEPNPGERVWRNLLKSDPSIDVVHFTILRTAEKLDAAPPSELALIPFPTDRLFIEKLKEFDLVIFDRYTWRNVLKSYHFDNIARFVEEGGAMLVASGPEYNGVLSLARRRTISYLLPSLPLDGTVEEPFRPVVTEAGERHPVTADLPDRGYWGRWLRAIPTRPRSGTTLISGPDDVPILILDRIGEGRVAMIQSDHIWLWARGFDGGGPHAELLRRTAHWLMKEPQLEEENLLLTSTDATLRIVRQTMAETPAPVSLTTPAGETQTVTLAPTGTGQFEAVLTDMVPGLYRAQADDLFAIGAVGLAAAPEFEDVVSDRRKLAPVAAQTGGGLYNARRETDAPRVPAIRRLQQKAATGVSALTTGTAEGSLPGRSRPVSRSASGPGWAGILSNKASDVRGRRSGPLIPPFAWLGLIGLCLILAWALESRSPTEQS